MITLNGRPFFPGPSIIERGLFFDGSAAAPSVSFFSDPDTGIFRNAAGRLGIASEGALALRIDRDANGGRIIGASVSNIITLFDSGRISIQTSGASLTLNPTGNNVLIGTATDSANGVLQLATHTTSAGGIGFGTDCTIYRSAAGVLDFGASIIGHGKIASNNPTMGMGYHSGAGGSQTQATSKATSVTLDKVCGRILTHNAALAAGASVSFLWYSSVIAQTDAVIAHIATGATGGAYTVQVLDTGTGFARLRLTNISAGSLSEAVPINVAVIKAVSS